MTENKEAKSLSPFDFVKSICETKIDLMTGDESSKSYVPFVINANLSTDKECLIMVNEMNSRPHLSKNQQYDFLINSISRKKRYLKYPKSAKKSDDLEIIKSYYECNTQKALEIIRLLNDDQIATIKTKMDTGGKR
jgi:hypothetical protein